MYSRSIPCVTEQCVMQCKRTALFTDAICVPINVFAYNKFKKVLRTPILVHQNWYTKINFFVKSIILLLRGRDVQMRVPGCPDD